MFLRIKKINNIQYAYLVDNRWYKRRTKDKGKGSRQKVRKYLGRVYSFDKVEDKHFFDFKKIGNIEEYIEKNGKNGVIKGLVEWELFRHNINKDEFDIDFINKKILKCSKNSENFLAHKKSRSDFLVNKKEVSLAINEGFLNSYTLARLLDFKFGYDAEKAGLELAKYFVEAGIEVPKEVFVGIFGKVYK